jgi:hypothetical protein
MFGKLRRAKEKPSRKLNRMNATSTISTGTKLLADGKANNKLPEHNHESAPASLYTIEEIHIRAEMMTPLLKEILDFHPPVHVEIYG